MSSKSIGCIYFVQAATLRLVKIGYSGVDPETRVLGLMCGCPDRLERLAIIPGTVFEETALHRRFASIRSHGEWFFPAPELMDFIASEGKPWDSWYARRYVTVNGKRDGTESQLRRERAAFRHLREFGKFDPANYKDMHPLWVQAYESEIARLEMTHWPLGIPWGSPTPRQLAEIERAVQSVPV